MSTLTILIPVFSMIQKPGRFAQIWAPNFKDKIGTLGVTVDGISDKSKAVATAMGLTEGQATATIEMSNEDYGFIDHISGLSLSPAINAGGTQLIHAVEGSTNSKTELLAFYSPNSPKRQLTVARKPSTKVNEEGKLYITADENGRQYQTHTKAATNPLKQLNMEDALMLLSQGMVDAIANRPVQEKVSTPRSTKSKVLSGM